MQDFEKDSWHKTLEWFSDCFKGIVGAVAATLLLAMLQYLGAHISDILHMGFQLVGGIAGVKVMKK